MNGVIKWFSAEKGYGFIVPEGGGEDVFCHGSALINRLVTPQPGYPVRYTPYRTDIGWRATEVKLLMPGGLCPLCGRGA